MKEKAFVASCHIATSPGSDAVGTATKFLADPQTSMNYKVGLG